MLCIQYETEYWEYVLSDDSPVDAIRDIPARRGRG